MDPTETAVFLVVAQTLLSAFADMAHDPAAFRRGMRTRAVKRVEAMDHLDEADRKRIIAAIDAVVFEGR